MFVRHGELERKRVFKLTVGDGLRVNWVVMQKFHARNEQRKEGRNKGLSSECHINIDATEHRKEWDRRKGRGRGERRAPFVDRMAIAEERFGRRRTSAKRFRFSD